MIRLEGVRKRYPGSEVEVLSGVDLVVERGHFVSIIGRSGSGKTTLLNVIGGLDRSFDGTAEVAGLALRGLSDRGISEYRSRSVGFVFQAYHLLDHLSCAENVALSSIFARRARRMTAAEVRHRAADVLADVGLAGAGARKPATLSGGERQRVALARALFHRPEILLCDEPTGNLDAETGRAVVELLRSLHEERGLTVVAATHDDEIAGLGGLTCQMRDGRITVAEGDAG